MYNSRTTFNYLINDIITQLSIDLNIDIDFLVEDSEFKQYPGVSIYYQEMGQRSDVTQEHYHIVDIDVFTACENTRDAIRIMEGIYNGLGLDHDNVHHFAVFDKYDYNRDITSDTPPKRGKIRVKLLDGLGWEKVGETEDVRQYTATFYVYYKPDFNLS